MTTTIRRAGFTLRRVLNTPAPVKQPQKFANSQWATFSGVPVGESFHYNGANWFKNSATTALHHDNYDESYFAQVTPVFQQL